MSHSDVLQLLDTSLIRLPALNQRIDYVTFLESRQGLEKAKETYNHNRLNYKQKCIYDYFLQHLNTICLVQAGPGCGKSFLLNTIAHSNPHLRIELIIFKKDLLRSFTAENIQKWTVARFMMNLLSINYKEYEALEEQLSWSYTPYEFMLIVISLLKAARLPDFKGSVVFLDEYTVIPKPLLFIILTLLNYYKIGTIICGDMFQLQNIHNSKHTEYLSSHSLACEFVPADANFTLEKNERCSNKEYNSIIRFFSKLSSSKKLDDLAYAVVAAVFPRQLFACIKFEQIHMAGTHEELTQLQHFISCQNGYPGEFYTIDQSRLRNPALVKDELIPTQTMLHYMKQLSENEERLKRGEPTHMVTVQKFLPYIPLVVGGEYYVGQYSEQFIGVLKEIIRDEAGVINSLKMYMLRNEQMIEINRSSNDAVIFDRHKQFLLQDGKRTLPGKIYGFPIYLTNFKTMHQGQGCTIPNKKINMILTRTTGEGLYVGASRVTDSRQIERVVIPNQIQHLVSTIINFPCLVRGESVSAELLENKFFEGGKYVSYNIKESEDLKQLGFLTYQFFFNCNDYVKRDDIRRQISHIVTFNPERFSPKVLSAQKLIDASIALKKKESITLMTLQKILQLRDIFLALAQINEIDRNVWLHEFILCDPYMRSVLPESFVSNSRNMDTYDERDSKFLVTFASLNESYHMETSSIEYIKSVSKTSIRTNETDQQSHARYKVEEVEKNVFLESSEFCANLVGCLRNEGSVNEEWLMNQLNVMLRLEENNREMNPKKKKHKYFN